MAGKAGDPMAKATVTEQKLRYLEYISRENEFQHHTAEEEDNLYALLQAGDMRAVELAEKIHLSGRNGHLSDDPVRNAKYLFVSTVTVACRAAISGGLPDERAFNISDLFIQRMDLLTTVDQVDALYREMFSFYTREMAGLAKGKNYSRNVQRCLDYIYHHLHTRILVTDLAEETGLNASYLSTLFKQETGMSISEYIADKRLEAARNMLRFSDYSLAEISEILAYSSQSHFTRAFKEAMGITPLRYRNSYGGQDGSWEQADMGKK